jgi:hypothetical protein
MGAHRKQFLDLSASRPRRRDHKFGSVPGYRDRFKGENWYYLTGGQLQAIIGTGALATALKTRLAKEGLLEPSKSGRHVVQRPIYRDGTASDKLEWVHAFKAKIYKRSLQGNIA